MKPPPTKLCSICGSTITRNKKLGDEQWDKRNACSRRCGAIKRDVGNDKHICSMYEDGYTCKHISIKYGLSATHICRILKEHGIEVDPYRHGSGGLRLTVQGYLRFENTKGNGKNAGRRLHSIIAEFKIGRRLRKHEVVHHIDGDVLNNHPNNLSVMSRSEHSLLHHSQGDFKKC